MQRTIISGQTVSSQRPNTVVIAGDSITAMHQNVSGTRDAYGGIFYNDTRGYWTWASAFLRHRLKLVKNAGVSGNTSAQLLARFDADVVAYRPGYVVLLIGTNDMIATTSLATLQSNVTAMLDKCDAMGALPIVLTLPPYSGASTAQLGVLHGYNYWLKTQGRTRRNLAVVDIHPALSDATAADEWINSTVAQFTADGTHSGAWGAARIGRLLADTLTPLVPAVDTLPFSSAEAGGALSLASPNLLANPGLTGTTGTLLNGVTGAAATNWQVRSIDGAAVAGTVAASKVTRTDQVGGQWQQVAATGSASQVRVYSEQVIGSGLFAAGTQVIASCEFQGDSDWTNVTTFRLSCGVYNGSFQQAQVYDFSFSEASNVGWPVENQVTAARGGAVLRTPVLTIPASPSGLYFALDFIGSGTFRFARPELRKSPA